MVEEAAGWDVVSPPLAWQCCDDLTSQFSSVLPSYRPSFVFPTLHRSYPSLSHSYPPYSYRPPSLTSREFLFSPSPLVEYSLLLPPVFVVPPLALRVFLFPVTSVTFRPISHSLRPGNSRRPYFSDRRESIANTLSGEKNHPSH